MRWESTRRRESEGDGEQEMRLEANKGNREEGTVGGGGQRQLSGETRSRTVWSGQRFLEASG